MVTPSTLTAAESSETLALTGYSNVVVPPLLERSYKNRRATIVLSPIADAKEAWQVEYERDGIRCVLRGTGPRRMITLDPKQKCTVKVDEADYRGTVVATLDGGSIAILKDGRTMLELKTLINASVQRRVSGTILGRTFEQWVPIPTPVGRATYLGTTSEP